MTAKQPTTQMRPPESDWRRIAMDDHFATAAGPWYWRLRDGVPILGMRVDERHISVRGACHGGVLMTMADLMSLPASYITGLIDRLVPTMTLSMDFVSPAGAGDWLEMHTDLLKRTRRTIFAQSVIRARGGDIVARSNAIFRILSEPDPRGPILHQLLGLETESRIPKSPN